MISDETAYRRYLNGEEQAADLLVERYGDALTLYINARIRDAHEAEDLMIEAFSLIFAKERPITGTGSFKAYLYKTARNLALRHSRKHRIPFLHKILPNSFCPLPQVFFIKKALSRTR